MAAAVESSVVQPPFGATNPVWSMAVASNSMNMGDYQGGSQQQQQQQQQQNRRVNSFSEFSNLSSSSPDGMDNDALAEPCAPSFSSQVAAARGFGQQPQPQHHQQQLEQPLQTSMSSLQQSTLLQIEQQQMALSLQRLQLQQQQQRMMMAAGMNSNNSMNFNGSGSGSGNFGIHRSPSRSSVYTSDYSEASSCGSGLDDSTNTFTSYNTDYSHQQQQQQQQQHPVPPALSGFHNLRLLQPDNDVGQYYRRGAGTGNAQQDEIEEGNDDDLQEPNQVDWSDLLTSPLIDCRIHDFPTGSPRRQRQQQQQQQQQEQRGRDGMP
jgi:hypothetical protein